MDSSFDNRKFITKNNCSNNLFASMKQLNNGYLEYGSFVQVSSDIKYADMFNNHHRSHMD